jgi:Glycosyltransferase family 87
VVARAGRDRLAPQIAVERPQIAGVPRLGTRCLVSGGYRRWIAFLGARWIRIPVAVILGGAAMVLTAHIVGRWYYDPALHAIAGWSVPPDFSDFYLAAEAVRSGHSPYQLDLPAGWLGYVYPPLLAWLLTPLTFLSVPVAVSLWALLSILFVVAALYVLGVRDWRCYPVALLWPFNRSAIEFGAIEGLLVLAVSLSWRYRETPVRASLAGGFSIALKLYVWPLALWHGLSGRTRTGLLTCAATVGCVLVPWALIGFQGLMSYPSLLRDAADQQANSWSLVALAEGLDFAPTFARTLSLAVGACLLFLSFRAARAHGDTQEVRDRRSFTLAIAAALALTPVVWNHYLLLLIVPVAIARPRLSGLWLLPLAANCLYLFDWYGPGDGLRPIIATTAIAAVTIAIALDAQARPSSNALTPMRIRVRRYRFWRSLTTGFALAGVLAVLFVLVPEKLSDRPYNPLGRDTSHSEQPSGARR